MLTKHTITKTIAKRILWLQICRCTALSQTSRMFYEIWNPKNKGLQGHRDDRETKLDDRETKAAKILSLGLVYKIKLCLICPSDYVFIIERPRMYRLLFYSLCSSKTCMLSYFLLWKSQFFFIFLWCPLFIHLLPFVSTRFLSQSPKTLYVFLLHTHNF